MTTSICKYYSVFIKWFVEPTGLGMFTYEES